MATVTLDTFTASNWKDLHLRTGELGATWTRHPTTASSRWYIFGNRVHCGVAGNMYASGVPASADYTVESDLIVYTTVTSPANLNLGIAGRMSTSADTYYAMYYQAGELVLMKRVAGVTTSLDVWTSTLTGGGTVYSWALEMIGDQIKGYVNDVERVSATDSSITAVGRAGVRSIGINDAGTGNHLDNFVVTDGSSAASPRSYAVGIIGI